RRRGSRGCVSPARARRWPRRPRTRRRGRRARRARGGRAMRVESLRVTGIGPFRTEQVVDFTAFAGDGLFLIAGKTGSGKSSILDAIVYGLYERLPRYDARG